MGKERGGGGREGGGGERGLVGTCTVGERGQAGSEEKMEGVRRGRRE